MTHVAGMSNGQKVSKIGKRGKAGLNRDGEKQKFMDNTSEAAHLAVQAMLRTIELLSADHFFRNKLKRIQLQQRNVMALEMKVQLRRLGPHNQITVLPLANGDSTWTAGRGSNSDIYILSQYVSRTHFSIKYRNKNFYVCDHGSANGTYINDNRMCSEQEYPLPLDSIISIGVATRHQNDPDCIVFAFETCKEEQSDEEEHKIKKKLQNTANAVAEVDVKCRVETHLNEKRNEVDVKTLTAEQFCQNPTSNEEVEIEIIEVSKEVSKSELIEAKEVTNFVHDDSVKTEKSEQACGSPDLKGLMINKTEMIAVKKNLCNFNSPFPTTNNAAISAEVDLFLPEGYADDEIIDAFEAPTQVDEPKLSYSLTEDCIEISDSEDDEVNNIKTEMGPISYVQTELEDDDYDDIICLDIIKSENKENYPQIKEIIIEDDDEYTETDMKWMGKLFKTKEECCSFIQSQRDDEGSGDSGESEMDWVDAASNRTEELQQSLSSKDDEEKLLETTENINASPKTDKLALDLINNDNSVFLGFITVTQEICTVSAESEQPDQKKRSPCPTNKSSPTEKSKRIKLQDPFECEDDSNAAKKRKITSSSTESSTYQVRLLNDEQPIAKKPIHRPDPKSPKTRKRIRCSTRKTRKPVTVLPISEIRRIKGERSKKSWESCLHLPQNQKIQQNQQGKPEVPHSQSNLKTVNEWNARLNSDKSPAKLLEPGEGESALREHGGETSIKGGVEGTSTQEGYDSCQRVPQVNINEEGNEVSREIALCDNLASCQLEKNTNRNLTDTGTTVGVLRSCLKKYGCAFMRSNRPIVPAKSVRFDVTRNIRYYETENKITIKTSSLYNRPRITSEMRLIRQKYAVISEMCKWNTKWLEESKKAARDELPPTFQREKLKNVQKSFPNHDTYMKTFLPLLLLELWFHVIQRWQIHSKGLYCFTAIFKNYVEDAEFLNENLGRITCESILQDSTIWPIFVREGDLVMIQLTKASVNEEGNESGCRKFILNIFGYLEKITVIKEDPTKMNPSIAAEGIQGSHSGTVLRVEILVMKRRDFLTYSPNAVPITGIYHAYPHLVMCQAVSKLPKSPLCQTILVPNRPAMTLLSSPCNENIFYKEPFDDFQRDLILRLVSSCINRDHALLQVQGGPGTGKTHVIMAFILQLLYTKQWKEGVRPIILFCSHSNVAVDHVTLKLKNYRESMSKEGRYKLVRVGRVSSMKPEVRDVSTCSLGFRNDKINIENKIKALNETINALVADLEASTVLSVINEKSSKLHACVKERDLLKTLKPAFTPERRPTYESERFVIEKADVVCTTFASSGSNLMVNAFERIKEKNPKRRIICVVDEAMQSKESETIVPLLLGVTHLILVGDSRQLKSPVRCELAQYYGLNQSLFWRILSFFQQQNQTSSPVITLKNQYRMNSAISALPSKLLYQGFLRDSVRNQKGCHIQDYVVLIDNAPPESSIEECERRLNEIAVNLVSEVLNTMGDEIADKNFEVITCNIENAKSLKATLSEKVDKKALPKFQVDPIEDVQGQEFDVVLAIVEPNMVSSARANVALTRAKHSLIVLISNPVYKYNKFLSNLAEDACVRRVSSYVTPFMEGQLLKKLVLKTPAAIH